MLYGEGRTLRARDFLNHQVSNDGSSDQDDDCAVGDKWIKQRDFRDGFGSTGDGNSMKTQEIHTCSGMEPLSQMGRIWG